MSGNQLGIYIIVAVMTTLTYLQSETNLKILNFVMFISRFGKRNNGFKSWGPKRASVENVNQETVPEQYINYNY